MNLHCLNAAQSIDAAFHAADAGSNLPDLYARFNRAAARALDEMHAALANKADDRIAVITAEREIIATCHRRAAELTATTFRGGAA